MVKKTTNVKKRFLKALQSERTGRLSLVPAFVITVFLLLIPGVYVFWTSLSSGVYSYQTVLNDRLFSDSLLLSIQYTAITVPIQILLGTLAAVIVHQLGINLKSLIIAIFVPYAIPSIVAVLSWRFLIEDKGMYAVLMNALFGITNNAWKSNLIFLSLCLISIWQFYPFVFVSVLARLRRVHPNLYRTAQLDGAGFWHQFKAVTFPEISSTLFAVLIVRIAFMFTKFDTAWLLAGKTVVGGVRVLPIYVYISNFVLDNTSIGPVAAIISAVILAFLLVVIAGLIMLTLNFKKYLGNK